jgi:NAD(P)-dependent dehydrogenase (short-subunit alcohol dehydrogenase family)
MSVLIPSSNATDPGASARMPGVERVAMVTGANTGIGLAIARRLIQDGYALAYATADDDESHLGPLGELEQKGSVAHIFGDLTDAATPARLVSDALERLGRIDVLVNNAGVVVAKPCLELDADDFDLTFGVDVKAAFLLSQGAAADMQTRGEGGVIVNITSVHEHVPRANFALYAAAKAALGMLTRGMALELAPHGIRVNAVAPGVIATPRNEADARTLDPQVPLGRPGTPEEVAALVSWLCSDEAAYVTGSSYVVDGGMIQQVVADPA